MKRIACAFVLRFVIAPGLAAQAPGQAAGQGRGQAPDPRSAGGGQCASNPYNCVDAPNPLRPPDTVWLEEMTWMDVRDAMKAGKTTILIATMNMLVTDPQSVRWDARVKAGKATINGVSIADKAKALETGRKIVEMRATNTVAAIRKAIANKGKAGD